MRFRKRFLGAALAALALGGCGSDPCGAAWNWATTCGLNTVVTEASFREDCQRSMESCTDSQKSEAASYYQCLASNKFCSGAGFQQCAQNMTLGAITCVNSFD